MKLVLRVDANQTIGSGHLMRSAALGAAWSRAGGTVVLVGAGGMTLPASLDEGSFEVRRIDATGGSDADAAATEFIASQLGAKWVVVDGQHFGVEYQQRIQSHGLKVLRIDDEGLDEVSAELVLNQNSFATESLYPANEAELLLGSDYVLLRPEFLDAPQESRITPPVARKLLVMMGGADPAKQTEKVVDAVSALAKEIRVRLVVGGLNPRLEQIRESCSAATSSIEVLHDVRDIPALMAWADLAVSAGGSTVWELAYLGVPTLVGATSPMEEPLVLGAQTEPFFVSLGRFTEVDAGHLATVIRSLATDPERRELLSRNGQKRIDGRGGERVVKAMLRLGGNDV